MTRAGNSAKTEKSNSIKVVRSNQLTQMQAIVSKIASDLKDLSGPQKDQLAMLESVSLGLYEEIDKLSKKAPAEPVTDLALTQINEVVKESKVLAKQDAYVQKLHEFVAAGNNPEHRDAVVVMRQIRQGLARFKVYITPAIEEKKILLSLAKGIQYAIQLYLDGQVQVSKEDLGTYSTHMRNGWIVGENRLFNFSKLDTIDLAEYFQLSDE